MAGIPVGPPPGMAPPPPPGGVVPPPVAPSSPPVAPPSAPPVAPPYVDVDDKTRAGVLHEIERFDGPTFVERDREKFEHGAMFARGQGLKYGGQIVLFADQDVGHR